MQFKYYLLLPIIVLLTISGGKILGQNNKIQNERKQLYQDGKYSPYDVLDTRVDNMRYWKKAAELGLTPVEPYHDVPKGTFLSTKIEAKSVVRADSPDVPVTSQSSTQSENSIFVDPTNPDHVLQSNNSTQNPVGSLYGANYFFSYDFDSTWGGSIQGAGGNNSGDPATAIGLGGRQYVGFINSSGGQGVSWSNNGTTWAAVQAGTPPGDDDILDKNHLWIDNSPTSPYEGNVYNAWTAFGNANNLDIEFVRSTDDGLSYSSHLNISSAINAGSHNQGVNISTGPDGEVYVVWTIYDSWPSDETALGFAKSANGGQSFASATRIISNIRGIRNSETSKNQRVNSFPSMTVDISGGAYNGNIYIVWTNIGVPGTNTGNDIDIYMIRSENEGSTWSTPIRVNQDAMELDNEHYFPWITCDPENGALSVVFYDDRNVGSTQCEVFCANSLDGGDTWEDFRVSDVGFTPTPISGLAGSYMGDYLGISARGGKVYPVWTDNRSGSAMTYTSPYETNTLTHPENLTSILTFETGQVDLSWDFVPVQGFDYFIVYRDDVELGTSTQNSFIDILPDYGFYTYQVTAMHTDGESAAAITDLQWGNAQIAVTPESLSENLQAGATSTRQITIENTGQLPLEFSVSSSSEPFDNTRAYCQPTANCSFGDGFTGFSMADISNLSSGCSANGYGNFTNMSTDILPGNSYEVSFMTGYGDQDVCLWIDFNKNEVFDDNELLLEDFNLASADQLYTTTITIPDGLESGTTRMRIKANWQNSANDPCADITYGETEDYTVNVLGWLFVDNTSGILAPGATQDIDVTFDAADLSIGSYYGNIHIENNDPDALAIDVPITLNVDNAIPLSIEVTAVPENIIAGESTQLNAVPDGGSETYTYSWTSDPAGFTSSIANPLATPDETTTFFVEVNDGVDVVSGSVLVTVEAALSSQDINLIEGWNLFSSKIIPENPDMLAVVQPLIDEDLLFKVIDENGGTVFHLPFPPPNGQWNNSIGDILQTEGYYIKLNADATLLLEGTSTELPLQIPLNEGWNMISYPCDMPQDALQLVQPLIDADLLYKVIDQQGGVVFHLPFPPPDGQWSNSIGNFETGQGYYVKVTADATLTINNPADGYQPPQVNIIRHDPVFFNPIYQNNPYQPMAVIVKTSSWMEPGDEIAVFDGDICVGATVFTNVRDEYLIIPVSMDDPETEALDGATSGNNFNISLWNRNGQNVYSDIDYDLIGGSNLFSALETSVIILNPLLTQLSEIDKPIGISLHPNPMSTDALLKISVPKKAFATINIFDAMGSTKAEVVSNMPINDEASITIQKSALHLQPGIYTLQIILSEGRDTNPVIKVMKFIVY